MISPSLTQVRLCDPQESLPQASHDLNTQPGERSSKKSSFPPIQPGNCQTSLIDSKIENVKMHENVFPSSCAPLKDTRKKNKGEKKSTRLFSNFFSFLVFFGSRENGGLVGLSFAQQPLEDDPEERVEPVPGHHLRCVEQPLLQVRDFSLLALTSWTFFSCFQPVLGDREVPRQNLARRVVAVQVRASSLVSFPLD